MFKINFHKIKIKDIQTHHQVNLGWVGLGGAKYSPQNILHFCFYSNVERILRRQQKSIFRPTLQFQVQPIWYIQQSIEIYKGHQENKEEKPIFFCQKRQHFLTNQTMGTTRCGEMQFHAGPTSSGVLFFISFTRTYNTIYTPTHDVCILLS